MPPAGAGGAVRPGICGPGDQRLPLRRGDQTVEIASVLARGARISIFDEPEAGIDLWSFTGLIEVFQEMKSRLTGALLIISHQERILEIADDIVVVADGAVRPGRPPGGCPSGAAGGGKGRPLPSGERRCVGMNKVTEKLLQMVSDWKGAFDGAYNIREDGSAPAVSL